MTPPARCIYIQHAAGCTRHWCNTNTGRHAASLAHCTPSVQLRTLSETALHKYFYFASFKIIIFCAQCYFQKTEPTASVWLSQLCFRRARRHTPLHESSHVYL